MGDQDLEGRTRKELRNWKEVIDADFPRMVITKKTRYHIMNSALSLRARLPVRIAAGMFYTDREYAQKRARTLSKPLPVCSPWEKIKFYLDPNVIKMKLGLIKYWIQDQFDPYKSY